jgi:hypothetical protein
MSDNIRVKSSIESLRGLIEEVTEGRLRLPAFQRSFTWRNDQIADLFDSVAQGYPIGSLFLWNTGGDHVTSSAIGPFVQPQRKPGSPVSLVIDGQHRVVTLAGVLLARPEDEARWQLYYDPKAGRFCHPPPGRDAEPTWVRVANLRNTLSVLQEARRLLELEPKSAPAWVERIERVARAITEYQIPVIGYSGDLNSAIEVFARLNQKGKSMGPDELLSALTYRETEGDEFRLASRIDELSSDVEGMGFGEVSRTVILRAILVAADLDIYSQDWSRLAKDLRARDKDRDLLAKAIGVARDGLRAAIEFLREEGVLSVRQLPYGMQLVTLSAYLGVNPKPDHAQRAVLSRMLWVSSFSAWFGPPAQERALVRELRALAKSSAAFDSLNSMDLDTPSLPIPSQVDQKSARVRALINVLAAQAPMRPDGSSLGHDIGPLLLTKEAGALARIFTSGPKDLLASPANRVIAVTNEGGTARPWLRKLDLSVRDDVLVSLAIPPKSFDLLEGNEAAAFLDERMRYLETLEREFMAKKGVTPPKQGAKPAPSPIDTDD